MKKKRQRTCRPGAAALGPSGAAPSRNRYRLEGDRTRTALLEILRVSDAAAHAAVKLGAGAVVFALLDAAVAPGQTMNGQTVETVRDFMIQNVCLDAAGAVEIGSSPLDGEAACPRQRDLLPGEVLPYHKHDHPSPEQRRSDPEGYQRHDSFPVETQGLGMVVEHSFDFGDSGRRFGFFDRGQRRRRCRVIGDGAVSFAATKNAGGFALWSGECRGEVAPGALTTLISEHYGGATEIARLAAWFAGTGRCGMAEPPASRARLVLIDCRKWTGIVPPDDSAGDRLGFWIEAIRTRPGAPGFFPGSAPEQK